MRVNGKLNADVTWSKFQIAEISVVIAGMNENEKACPIS